LCISFSKVNFIVALKTEAATRRDDANTA